MHAEIQWKSRGNRYTETLTGIGVITKRFLALRSWLGNRGWVVSSQEIPLGRYCVSGNGAMRWSSASAIYAVPHGRKREGQRSAPDDK